ncbi:MAG: hypothetical protein IPM61_11620 [Chlorobi bacterium]|nr:MAG: hypothetical protein UZ07_CHB004001115 [Chlorobi bacterium OLB7]MBK8911964.1 hypothetical protein [Chlorobiota bacterium]MBX7215397.1 hypothetical protein [Candidatus Kapabacteria bacterium]
MNRPLASLLLLGGVFLLEGASGLLAQRSYSTAPNPLDPNVPRSQIVVGPTVGVTRNWHTGGFRTIDEPNCPTFEQGAGWGVLAGLTAEYQTPWNWTVVGRVSYQTRPGSFRQYLPDAEVILPSSQTSTTQTVRTDATITYNLVAAELAYNHRVARLAKGVFLNVEAGPAFSVVLGGSNRQVQDLIEPQNARFVNPDRLPEENNGRRLILFDGQIPGRNSTRFSMKGGVQLEVGLFGNDWIMYPGIYFDYGLSRVTNNENWNLNTAMFQVDFRHAF